MVAKKSRHFVGKGTGFIKGGPHCCCPAGNGSDDTDRGCGGIDDIGQLCPRNPVFIRDWLHDRTDGQAVEIIVNEDQDSQDAGSQFSGPAAGDFLGGPVSVGLGSPGFVHHADQGAQKGQEQDDIEFIRGAHGLGHDFESGRTHIHQAAAGSSCIEQSSGKDPQHQ